MKVITHRMKYKLGDVIKIKPIFDVHLGNVNCDKKKFKKYLEDSDDKTRFFGGGDLLDSITITDKRYAKHIDSTETSSIIDDQVDEMIDILTPYKDRIMGLGAGNHEDTIVLKCGTNPTARMAKALEVPFMGYSGLIRFSLTEGKGRGRLVKIRWHHGWGGGSRTAGADITKYSKDCLHWEADVFLYGHVHRKQADRIPRFGLVGEKIVEKPIMLGICGSYLKTYTKTTDASYSEKKGYPPTEIGGLVLNIKPSSAEWVNMWIDV